jgi:hypothetical protein
MAIFLYCAHRDITMPKNTKKKLGVKKSEVKSSFSDKFIMICPKCKSPDVDRDISNPLTSAAGLPSMFVCHICSHTGYNFPEIPLTELETFEKEAKTEGLTELSADRTPKVDLTYGNFQVRFIWKITGPISVLLGIIAFNKSAVLGISFALLGAWMIYVSFFKKRAIVSA